MLALIVSMMMTAPAHPSVLNVPITPFVEATTTPQDLWIEKLHECENRNDVPWIVDTNGKKSYGYVMFQMGTWLSYGKKFGASENNISSSTLQKRVARSMLDNGGQGHWYWCAKKLGDYPK